MENTPEFNPGYRVVIREWDDMADQYGIDARHTTYIPCQYSFTENMKFLCGQEGTIRKVAASGFVTFEDLYTKGYSISTDMIRMAEEATSPVDVDISVLLPFMKANMCEGEAER